MRLYGQLLGWALEIEAIENLKFFQIYVKSIVKNLLQKVHKCAHNNFRFNEHLKQ